MPQIIDQIVKISIQDAISSVTTTDVNTMAIVGKSTVKDAVAGEYASTDDVKTAFGADSELAKMAAAIFAQDSQPSAIVCIPAADFGSALDAVQKAASNFNFYHVCAFGATTTEQLDSWQEWLADVKKVLHVQVAESATGKTLVEGLNKKTADRVAIYLHKDGEYLNASIVALRCSMDSAKGTFAHKKCKGISPDTYTSSQFKEFIDAGLNIYTTVAGEARLFMGTTCNAKTFIDQKVKDDWIRFNVQSRIFTLLGEGNDGAGVNYDDAGIAAVAACVSNVFTIAADTTHQYIMDGASVDFKDYAYIKNAATDSLKARKLPFISGKYRRMNSVHVVDEVKLQVTL